MEAQQETSRVLNLQQLDLILSLLPDPAGAKVLRDQFVSACRIVERKEDEAEAMHERAESQSKALQVQLERLKTEREAFQEQKNLETEELEAERVKLQNLAQTLSEQFRNLATNVGQVSGNVSDCQKTVAEKLEGFREDISARASGREENVNQSLRDLHNSVKKNTDDLSTVKDKSIEMATAMASVNEEHKQIKSSLNAGVTMGGIKVEIAPLVELANTIKTAVQGLPTVDSLDTKFAQIGGLAEKVSSLQDRVLVLAQENQTLKNENAILTAERNDASNLSERAKAALEEYDEDLKAKESKIEDLQKSNDDLRNRLIEAGPQISQGQEARRRLVAAQDSLQTAATTSQELSRAKGELQQAERTERGLNQKITDLESRLECEKTALDICSSQLTEALANQSDVNREKQKLEDDLSKVRTELNELRAQQALDLQKQLKDQYAAVSEAMKTQLSEKRTHEETVGRLSDSWSSEKEALQGQISAKASLIENLEQQLQKLQSTVSTLEPLQSELHAANDDVSRMNALLEESNLKFQNSQARVTELQGAVSSSTNELDHLKAENGRLQKSGESVSGQLRTSEDTIQSLQRECENLNKALSSLQDQSVRIPEGAAGEVSRVFYRAADELRDIPIVIDTNGLLSTPQLAAQLITLIDWYNWKENLLTFLQSRSNDWVCVQQIMAGDSNGKANGDKCKYHNDCLLMKVASLNELPGLKFMMTR
ncbi:uncharacterized protein FSUBG_13435 [Fusarium subglutinans]|uniref:Uncharacterized protein n=1 Tax=Gibberella subglutinans TaxID=42677 RepID=A0A8H5NVI8_GIBSU|nr:uncharacterized protein FSUBG_13435 [Fusarium subglutinans]KAF5580282.1 hypothetical protein FSUBG_13435 [Fusarium subglutinans]